MTASEPKRRGPGASVSTLALLEQLVAFPTVSARSNLDLVDFVRGFLAGRGIVATLVPDASGQKASLFASVGPAERPGVLLSGHADVVPVEGQAWTTDPFALVERGGRLFGRGAADMKGFVAAALRAMAMAADRNLAEPLHLALSYDEEVGCVGVRPLLGALTAASVRPRLCLVGEPTSMAIGLGHKGKIAARATCTGVEGHSALAPRALNAIHLAADLIGTLRDRQAALEARGLRDDGYDIPYTTIHAGLISGGTALNIVPNRAVVDFEIRTLPVDDGDTILRAIAADAEALASSHRVRFSDAAIRVEAVNAYPGLDTDAGSPAARFVSGLLGTAATTKLAFGTEAGLFARGLERPALVCGPGSIEQAHKPDEFISRDQIEACDRFLDRLVDRLCDPG